MARLPVKDAAAAGFLPQGWRRGRPAGSAASSAATAGRVIQTIGGRDHAALRGAGDQGLEFGEVGWSLRPRCTPAAGRLAAGSVRRDGDGRLRPGPHAHAHIPVHDFDRPGASHLRHERREPGRRPNPGCTALAVGARARRRSADRRQRRWLVAVLPPARGPLGRSLSARGRPRSRRCERGSSRNSRRRCARRARRTHGRARRASRGRPRRRRRRRPRGGRRRSA